MSQHVESFSSANIIYHTKAKIKGYFISKAFIHYYTFVETQPSTDGQAQSASQGVSAL